MLFAQREGNALALACSVPWLNRSVGIRGIFGRLARLGVPQTDDLELHASRKRERCPEAEIDLNAGAGEFLLPWALAVNATEAGNRARASLQDGFAAAHSEYVRLWKRWQDTLLHLDKERTDDRLNFYRVGTAIIRTHEAFNFHGGIIASLSIPWGFSKGDNDLGGYHLVWPRDLVESAGGLLAAGAHAEVRSVLCYLQATQEADGHWAQNMWLDGSPYWDGIQMDETALPVLLVDLARREKGLTAADVARFWPMVQKAAAYLVRNGPVSPQDRWEEDPGYSPFTVAAEIAALLAAADLADLNQEPSMAAYLRETADIWHASIDHWMYVSATDWCREFNVAGYYVRIAPVDAGEGVSRFQQCVPVKNISPDRPEVPPAIW